MTAASLASPAAFHVMTKPIGPICNLDCQYCFYLEKEKLYPDKSNWRMPENVLERYVQQFIEAQDVPEITFAFQGGEPTLMGKEFFQRVVGYQRKHANGKTIANTLQTNGTLLDDEWCALFKEHGFLIGLSIDGPRKLHDRYRVDKQGRPTFDEVMRGMSLLRKHGVEFNNLVVVHRGNQRSPLEIYRFLKESGSGFMQFIPLVERAGGGGGPLDFAEPPALQKTEHGIALPIIGVAGRARASIEDRKSKFENPTSPVTEFSVEPLAYGEFLCSIFDEWVRNDVGRTFVQIFDVMLGIWMGMPAGLCVFGETCGNALALEHNGDLYSCDHYVYPRYKLGNVMDRPLREMIDSPQQRQFGLDKRDLLPRYCQSCEVRFACNGECPKHRFLTTPDGEFGLNYLCAGYKRFLNHIDPSMRTMARLLQQGRPAAEIMRMLADESDRKSRPPADVGRNDACPCGSGKKFKRCCGR